MAEWFNETLYEHYGQRYEVDEVLFEHKGLQHIVIFKNRRFGRVLALDGVIQSTEADEFIYHEMMVHVPLFAHGACRRVLIIGGGDGGILREVLKHKGVEKATMVEIDGAVVEMCKKHMPGHSDGAFDSPRTNLVIADGIDFVKNCTDKFDAIISDSTDPIGPGEVLFTDSFYASCKKLLNPGGVLTTQNGVAFMQGDEVSTTYSRMKPVYKDAGFYVAAVPTYIGGFMTLAWGTDDESLRETPVEILRKRLAASNIKTRYYTPEIHKASFALPGFVVEGCK